MRKVDTLVFLKLWEQINNINFNIDFEGFVNGSIVIMLESNHLYLIIQTIVNCIVPRCHL